MALAVLCATMRPWLGVQAQTTNLLVDLDASGMADASAWANAGTLGAFSPIGNPVLETVAGLKAVTFAGNGDAFVGPAATAEIGGSHARTVEVWAYNPGIAEEETLVAWGRGGGNPDGSDMAFNYGLDAASGAVRHWGGNFNLSWGSPPPAAGQWHYLVYTYDGATAKVYDNAKLSNQRAVALATAVNTPVVVGAQNDLSGQPQVAFSGSLSIAKVRLRSNALTAADVAASFQKDLGALRSIDLRVEANMVVGGVQQAAVIGAFANMPQLTLADGLAYSSSAPQVATVGTNGVIQALAAGSAQIVVKYQGQQAAQTITVTAPVPAVLKHRYSFNAPVAETIATDPVGGAAGALVGGASFTGDGALTLDGADGYLDLPNGILSALTNATFDMWVTWNGDANAGERVFDFGNNNNGEDLQGQGTTYFYLTPQGNNGLPRLVVNNGAGEETLSGTAAFPAGVETHLTVVYHYGGFAQKLYINGQLAATGPMHIPLGSIQDVNNWLGRSQFGTDPNFNGRYDEFRIYDGVLTDAQIALNDAAGPDQVADNPGNLKSLALSLPASTMILGAFEQATVLAAFENLTNINVTHRSGTSFQSANSQVVRVSTSGQLEALAVGSAAIIAQYETVKATNIVTVAAVEGVPAKPELEHRYSFSETNGTVVADSVGGADGEVADGAPSFLNGQLVLNGAKVVLPGLLLSTRTNVTLEAWVTWAGGSNDWQQIFDFGGTLADTGDPLTWFGISARRGDSQQLGFAVSTPAAAESVLNAPAALPTNRQAHVVLSYNYAANAVRLYVNSVNKGVAVTPHPLSQLNDINNYLGAAEGAGKPPFNGKFNEFRIYNGAMLDAEVTASYLAGPDWQPTPPTPPSLLIARSGTSVVLAWPVAATGYALESTVKLGTNATWQAVSGEPVADNGTNKLTLTPAGTVMFYRLKN